MGRHKEFEPDTALGQAMELFWCQGYEATSIQDLVDGLGISRASLYATFGGKRQLYLLALERYRTRFAGQLVAQLDAAQPVLPALRGVLAALADEALADPLRRGCLAVNAAMEVAPHDVAVSGAVAATFADIEGAVHRALLRAQVAGEVRRDRDARALARFLAASINGLRVTGKATPQRDALTDIVQITMEAIT